MAPPLNFPVQSARSTASSLNIPVLPICSMAPTPNNALRYSAASGVRASSNNYLLPVYPMVQPSFPHGPPLSSRHSDPTSELANLPTSFVDVDKIVRLRKLNNNVYLISKNDQSVNSRASIAQNSNEDDVVQIGVVVNDSPNDPQHAICMPQSSGEQMQPSVQRLVLSLKKQVRKLQSQLDEVQNEFQVRYHREMNLSEKVRRLEDCNRAAARFKCDQATQVDIPKSTACCEQGVQTFGPPSMAQISASESQVVSISTGDSVVGNDQESSQPINEMLPVKVNGLHHSLPANDTKVTGSPSSLIIGAEPGFWSSDSVSHPSSCEYEDTDDAKPVRRRYDSSKSSNVSLTRRMRKRSSISPTVNDIRLYDAPDSSFPSDYPFWRSKDISKPPKVPLNYCNACYEKADARMLGKFCATCRFHVGRLRKAYIANKEFKLPHCSHKMGDPKRHCRGCIFKAYAYRHNQRNPSQPLPVPKED